MRIAILTVSDSAARGERTRDASGDAIAAWSLANGHVIADRATLPDGTVEIVRHLLRWCDWNSNNGLDIRKSVRVRVESTIEFLNGCM